jgi:anti-sigma factor RsiW
MEHSDVVRLDAVEKYVLGELPANLRDEFEEHYFDCAECAADVKHMMTFMTAGRMVLEETPRVKEATPATQPEKRDWLAWLRPAIAVPAMAALAAIVIFQNVVTIPELKRQGDTDVTATAFSSSYHLQGAMRGESGSSAITVGAKESFALDFDFTPAVVYPSYVGRIVNASGKPVLSFTVSGEMANKEMHLVVPGGLVRPGEYALVFAGASQPASTPEVQRIAFAVAFRP